MKNPTRAETPKNQNIKTDILILGPPAYGFGKGRKPGGPADHRLAHFGPVHFLPRRPKGGDLDILIF